MNTSNVANTIGNMSTHILNKSRALFRLLSLDFFVQYHASFIMFLALSWLPSQDVHIMPMSLGHISFGCHYKIVCSIDKC